MRLDKTVYWFDEECYVQLGQYQNPRNLAIQLFTVETHEPMMKVTVNPDMVLDKGLVAIKDYSENEGILQVMVDAGLIEDTGEIIEMGYVSVNVCKLLFNLPEEN